MGNEKWELLPKDVLIEQTFGEYKVIVKADGLLIVGATVAIQADFPESIRVFQRKEDVVHEVAGVHNGA